MERGKGLGSSNPSHLPKEKKVWVHLSANQYSSGRNLKGMEYTLMVSQEIEREAHVSIELENINIANQDSERGDDALIEIELQYDPVVTSYRGMLESLSPLLSECCIYRVPEKLCKVNEEAYTPRVVSIGPFHRGEKRLQAMEEHKLRFLQTFLKRTELSLEDYVKVVRMWEERARHCYAETIELSSDEFVKMILGDGSFIVELLLRSYFHQFIDESDRIFHKPWMIDDVCHDMILLENQLPFFVLEGFLNLVSVSNQEGNPSLLELTHKHFNHFLNGNKLPDTIFSPKIKHFVDFIRCSYLSSLPRVPWPKGNARYEFPPTVTKLQEAGIKFKMGTSCSLLDIKFTNGVLEIPHLMIEDMTEILFRNLIAFEQCHCTEKYIIHYMTLLVGMINTSKDVDLLIHHKILTSVLGNSEDVSKLFNCIGKEVVLGHKYYFSSLCENLNAYCRTPWHRWKVTLKRDYFNTPWAIVSIIAALVLLVLTFIQAVCSVISV